VTVDELVELVLARGCGKHLSDLTDNPEYGELAAKYSLLPDHQMAALAELCGCELIQAAKGCLPIAAHEIAAAWPTASAEGQLILLRLLHPLLREKHESERGPKRRGRQARQTAAAVLPAEHGVYPTGPVNPSCGGMGTLLMAWAELAGAPHYCGHVVFTNYKVLFEMRLRLLHIVQTDAKGRFPVMDMQGELDIFGQSMRTMLANTARIDRFNFHPSLVIQIRDGRWVLFDPYLGTLSLLGGDWDIEGAAARLDEAEFGTVMPVSSHQAFDELAERWVKELDVLRFVIEQAWSALSPTIGGVISCVYITQHAGESEALAFLAPKLAELNINTSGNCEEWLMRVALFGNAKNRSEQDTRAQAMAIQADPALAQLAIERVLFQLVRAWLATTWDLCRNLKDQALAHMSLELMRPAEAVAGTVLENVRCFARATSDIPTGGALSLISSAQAVWLGAWRDTQHRRQLDPRVRLALTTQMKALEALGRTELHPDVYQLLLQLRNGRNVPPWLSQG
jgi:hypothetical protein